jgi:hypothetical protein
MARIHVNNQRVWWLPDDEEFTRGVDLTPYLSSFETRGGAMTNVEEFTVKPLFDEQRNIFDPVPWSHEGSYPVGDIRDALDRIKEKHTWLT